MRPFPTSRISTLLSLLAAGAVSAQDYDADYPPGTLTPRIDLGLQRVEIEVPEKYRDRVPEGLSVNLPPGFSARLFAVVPGGPRDLQFSPEGVLHAVTRRGQVMALPDRDGDGVADEETVVLGGLRTCDALAFYKGDMYVGEEHQVIRAIDADGDGLYEETEVLVGDLPYEAWHDTKTIVFDEQNEKLYVSVGSPCDLCRMEPGHQFAGASTTDVLPYRPERGTVMEFNADGTGGRIFATGVRNVVGMALHPVTNELWGTNNGHDEEGRSRPPEWIDVLRDGDFQGYPFVQSHQVWNDFTISRYHPMLPITREDTLLAMTQKKPAVLVPAHWAPMRIHFYTGEQFPSRYRNAAFVAFRAGRAKLSSHPGYKVQALFSEPDGSDAVMADFVTGFQTGTTTSSVWGFPHGIASDAEGSLYVGSDNRTTVILKITHSQLQGVWEHDLPESVGLAGRVTLRGTVRLERLAEGGEEPRVTADLSALGGPAEVELTPLGDGEYGLEVELVAGEVGRRDIVIRVEQRAGERTESLRFASTVYVLPPIWSHDLPAGLTLGDPLELRATVRIAPLSADGADPRVTADLSAMGGPAEVPLSPAGGDAYSLRAVVDLDVPPGTYPVLVRFEQEVGGVVFRHEFRHDVVLSPPDLPILDDGLAGGWQLLGEQGAQIVGPTEAGPVFNGRESLELHLQPENFWTLWRATVVPPSPVDIQGFAGLRLVLHVGAAAMPGPAALSVVVDDLSVDLLRPPYEVVPGDPGWQVVEIDFDAFTVENRYGGQDRIVEEVDAIVLRGSMAGTLYLDDVRLVTRIPAAPPEPPEATSVSESHVGGAPGEYALGPSYPNPFNAGTVVLFDLPEAGEARLSVYNLAGQRVVELVRGRREAGTHRVSWDGRDASGGALASGVYLVRLTAGSWIGTEKLLLLR